jgi:hypothetical protein
MQMLFISTIKPNVNIFVIFRELADVINRAKFAVDRFNCFEAAAVQSLGLGMVNGLYHTGLRYRATIWFAVAIDSD